MYGFLCNANRCPGTLECIAAKHFSMQSSRRQCNKSDATSVTCLFTLRIARRAYGWQASKAAQKRASPHMSDYQYPLLHARKAPESSYSQREQMKPSYAVNYYGSGRKVAQMCFGNTFSPQRPSVLDLPPV